MDNVDSATRSRIMSAVPRRDTKPEVALRRALTPQGPAVPTAREGPSRQPGHRVPAAQDGRLRPRLFLARPRLLAVDETGDPQGVLDGQVHRQSRARLTKGGCATRRGMARRDRVGMRPEQARWNVEAIADTVRDWVLRGDGSLELPPDLRTTDRLHNPAITTSRTP